MEEINKHMKALKKTLKHLNKFNIETMNKIKDEEPEKVNKILSDNKKIITAINERDVETLLKIQKDYADNSDK